MTFDNLLHSLCEGISVVAYLPQKAQNLASFKELAADAASFSRAYAAAFLVRERRRLP